MINHSYHFVALEEIPQFEGQMQFRQIYDQLYQRVRSGFIISQDGKPLYYVKGLAFAGKMLADSGGDAEKLNHLSHTAIGDLLAKPNLLAEKIVLSITEKPVDVKSDEAPLRHPDEEVFTITEHGDPIGWYLNHEPLRDTLTGRTVFVCARGHKNPDTDHGRCYKCPSKILTPQQE